jgi:hypothetical protein
MQAQTKVPRGPPKTGRPPLFGTESSSLGAQSVGTFSIGAVGFELRGLRTGLPAGLSFDHEAAYCIEGYGTLHSTQVSAPFCESLKGGRTAKRKTAVRIHERQIDGDALDPQTVISPGRVVRLDRSSSARARTRRLPEVQCHTRQLIGGLPGAQQRHGRACALPHMPLEVLSMGAQ